MIKLIITLWFFSKSLKDLQDQAIADFEEAKREKLTEENRSLK